MITAQPFSTSPAARYTDGLADSPWPASWRTQSSPAATLEQAKAQFEFRAVRPGYFVRPIISRTSFEERLFDHLVLLKMAASQYAMHLSATERRRIFDRLDSVLNIDDWHDDDALPELESFRNFLKWMIYSRDSSWSSIGVSNEGNILIAWSRPDLALTANFWIENKVTWTATVARPEGPAHAVGSCSLQYFTDQSRFYLERAVYVGNEHPG